MASSLARVVVLGAGYAGVRVARDLARAVLHGEKLEVVLVSGAPHHVDIPLLYEVATAYLPQESTLSSEIVQQSISVPIRELFSSLPITWHEGTVHDIKPKDRLITFVDGRSLSFDILVVAVGAALATYGISGVNEHAFSVKNLHAALELRHHIVRQFMMVHQLDAAARRTALSFVVVGAGAAGVETAAELHGHIRKLCEKYHVAAGEIAITLVEAAPEILSMLSPALRTYAMRRLHRLGVRVLTSHPITSVESNRVVLADGRTVRAGTTIWTGGLTAHPLLMGAELPVARWGLACTTSLQVEGYPHIFVAGDAAVLTSYPEKIPAAVPVAYAQGKLVAANILRLLHGQPLHPYQYHTMGALIAMGGKSVIALFPGGRGITGLVPWLIKKIVELRYWKTYLSWSRALAFWYSGLNLHNRND